MHRQIRGKWLLLTWPVAGLVLLLAKHSEAFAERVFARGVYRVFHTPVALLTGLLPFSLAEWILYGLIPVDRSISFSSIHAMAQAPHAQHLDKSSSIFFITAEPSLHRNTHSYRQGIRNKDH